MNRLDAHMNRVNLLFDGWGNTGRRFLLTVPNTMNPTVVHEIVAAVIARRLP